MPCKECNTAQFQDVPFTMQRNNVGKLQWTTALFVHHNRFSWSVIFRKEGKEVHGTDYFFNRGRSGWGGTQCLREKQAR